MINLPPEPNCEVTARTPEGKLPLEDYLRLRGYIKEICRFCTPDFVNDDSVRMIMCDEHQAIDEVQAAADFKKIGEEIAEREKEQIVRTERERIKDKAFETKRESHHREMLVKKCMKREDRRVKKRNRRKAKFRY